MKPVNGVIPATVVDLDDPENLGRIRVQFSWMSSGEPVSNWARIAVPMAGPERGIQFMPEVGDEVLVAFERGQREFPYILGFLWNGQDRPVEAEEHQKRTIRTVSGHELEFDDTDGSEKISLRFKGKSPSIELREDKLRIEFDGNNFIELDDSEVTIVGNLIHLNPEQR
jgi:uncharacterized protein involved in type VI secretion and phage assembly